MGGNSGPGYRENPGYRVDIQRIRGRVDVAIDEHLVCSTTRALEVDETELAPVIYVPKGDLREDFILESETETYCPFKGFATYWSLQVGNRHLPDALWAYANPFDEVSELADYVGIYANQVDAIRIGGQNFRGRVSNSRGQSPN